ncbi:Phage minor structural protein GP20 [compost metagenome]
MDWLKALLKAQGLTDEQIEKIVGDAGKEIPKHFVPKSQYNEVSEAKKQAEKNVADRDKQLEDLKKSSGDAEALRAQITKLQEDNNTAKAEYEAELKDMKINAAIEKALTTAKAKHPELLTSKIDKEKLELLADGTIKGLDDQIKPLQESYKELFEPEDTGGNPFQFKGFKPTESGAGGSGGGGKDDAVDFGKKMAEYAKANNTAVEAQKHYFE